MTSPTDKIPEDIMREARRLAKEAIYHGGVDWAADDIARALMSSDERAARIAESYSANRSIWMSDEWDVARLATNYAGQAIASAIRGGR